MNDAASTALPCEFASVLAAIKATPMHEAVAYVHLDARIRGVIDGLVARGLVRIVNSIPRAL